MNRRLLSTIIATTLAAAAIAQSGTNSPYSQYGLGVLADRSQSFSRGMNGASLALRRGNVVNTMNPASYSAVDSLTMIFDVAMSGQITNFKEDRKRVNAKNANFEYAVGLFRLLKGVGMTFGILPYSNVGYKYTASSYLDATNGTITETYSGEGGLHQAFLGAGVRLLPQLSLGVNVGYLWGSIDRTVTSSSTTYINSLYKIYSASVNSYTAEAGLQFTQRITKTDELTLGVTASLGHKLKSNPDCSIINAAVSGLRDTTTLVAHNALELPMTYGVGLGWQHGNKLFVDADVMLQKWGDTAFPAYSSETSSYAPRKGLLRDRWKASVGANFVPNSLSRNYLNRVHYRLGAGYATPYYNINGKKGPSEISLSAGFGLPLQNAYNNRSMLHISGQWVHTSADGMIRENMFRLNVGLTFNERWFFKWKID